MIRTMYYNSDNAKFCRCQNSRACFMAEAVGCDLIRLNNIRA